MTLIYMEGFESCRQDSDIRSRGILQTLGSTNYTGSGLVIPSSTGTPGFGLAQLSPAVSPATNGLSTAAGSPDLGMLSIPYTINQLWKAGGFTVGCSARINSGVTSYYGAGNPGITQTALAYDGQGTYYALGNIGGVFKICYSTNLNVWTPCPNQPAIALTFNTTLVGLGNGTVTCVIGNATVATTYNAYSITAPTNTWTALGISAGSVAIGTFGCFSVTGNASKPHILVGGGIASSGTNIGGVWVGTVGGTMTNVIPYTGAVAVNTVPPVTTNGLLVAFVSTTTASLTIWSALPSATLTTAGNWSTATCSTALGLVYGVQYINGVWVCATSTGIWTIPGAANTALTGAVTASSRYSAGAVYGLKSIGGVMYAWGASGAMLSSPDGTTWTQVTSSPLPTGTGGLLYSSCVYDGTQFILGTDSTSGCIFTTPNFTTNWACQYTSDKASIAPVSGTSTDGFGFVWAVSALPVNGTVASVPNGQYSYFINATVPVANVSTIIINRWLIGTGNSGAFTYALNTATSLTHYFEQVYKADPNNPNAFFFSLYIDGVLVFNGGPASFSLTGSATDITSTLVLSPIARNQTISQVDDFYITLNDGIAPTGPLGPVNVTARRANTDVSTQWVKNGTAASNSLSTNQAAPSSLSGNNISSTNFGDTDQYGSSDPVNAGRIVATTLEAFVTKSGPGIPQLQLGLKSGSAQVVGALIPASAPNHWAPPQQFNTDPATGKPWTQAGLQATNLTVVHSFGAVSGTPGQTVTQPSGYRYVKLNHLTCGASQYVMIGELAIVDTASGNNWCLKSGVVATASSYYSDGVNPDQLPSQAVDGFLDSSPAHRWTSAVDQNATSFALTSIWFLVDLGVKRSFDSVQIGLLTGFGQEPSQFTIEVSNDGTNFTVLKTVTGATYANLTMQEVLKT